MEFRMSMNVSRKTSKGNVALSLNYRQQTVVVVAGLVTLSPIKVKVFSYHIIVTAVISKYHLYSSL